MNYGGNEIKLKERVSDCFERRVVSLLGIFSLGRVQRQRLGLHRPRPGLESEAGAIEILPPAILQASGLIVPSEVAFEAPTALHARRAPLHSFAAERLT
jgi:hypothetical protein